MRACADFGAIYTGLHNNTVAQTIELLQVVLEGSSETGELFVKSGGPLGSELFSSDSLKTETCG